MKTIGIRLADGSFYSIMKDGIPGDKMLGLTTVKDNQSRVLVDMYRSSNGTMEDAQYIGSLQIENLVAHPHGIVDISLRLSLDEENQLSAEMVDKETGGASNAKISLVSRTLEERMEPAEYEVIREPDATVAVAGGGLLAAAERMNINESEPPAEADLPVSEDEILSDFTVPDFDGAGSNESAESAPPPNSAPSEAEPEVLSDFELPDFGGESVLSEPPPAEKEPDLPPLESEDTIAEDFALPENDGGFGAGAAEEAVPGGGTLEEFDVPDFGGESSSDSEKTLELNAEGGPEKGASAGGPAIFDDFEIPDLPDFGEIDEADEMKGKTDDASSYIYGGDSTMADGINFSGLYDKETVEGNSAADDSYDVKKKTKAPVIICVVCAIICIIATLLVLFIVPSKYNLLNKGAYTEQDDSGVFSKALPLGPEPLREPEPEPVEDISAKEDEVVVIIEPEKVVPAPPAAPEVKPESITYKIKWGDTLWDIADAYYKNPWRYRMIARYNGIKDPDYIISGRTIELPAE